MALLTLTEVAERLYKTERWLKDYFSAHPLGMKAGRTRLFTEDDFSALSWRS